MVRKACPGLDPGWTPVVPGRRKKIEKQPHAKNINRLLRDDRLTSDSRSARGSGLPLRNTGETQPFHIAFAVELLLDQILLGEALQREIRLERHQLVEIGLCLLAPSKMSERGEQRLVAVDEVGVGLHRAAPGLNGLLVIAEERVGDGVEGLDPEEIRMERSKLAVALELFQRLLGLADIAVGRRAERPDDREIGIETKRAVVIVQRGLEIAVGKGADMRVDAERLGILRIEPDRANRVVAHDRELVLDVAAPALAHIEHMTGRGPRGPSG